MNYTFRNKNTGEEFILEMKMDEREQYLQNNPDVEQILIPLPTGDAVRMGFQKPDSTFSKYILGKVKEQNPLGNVERKFGNIPREI
jgi:hypothetical protein